MVPWLEHVKELVVERGAQRASGTLLQVGGTVDVRIRIFDDFAVFDAAWLGADIAVVVHAELALDHACTMHAHLLKDRSNGLFRERAKGARWMDLLSSEFVFDARHRIQVEVDGSED